MRAQMAPPNGPTRTWRFTMSSLDLAELDGRDERPIRPGRPAADDDRPREQLLGRERDRQDVVHAQVERLELGLQVAAPGEAEDRRDAAAQAVRRAESLEEAAAVVVVHVDDRHVRAPVDEDRLGLRQVARRTDDEQPVIERQPDEVHDQRPIVEDQRPTRLDLWSRRPVPAHDVSADPSDPGGDD